jgi:hypothetical protein
MTVADDIRSFIEDLEEQIANAEEDARSAVEELALEIEDLRELLDAIENPEDPSKGELISLARDYNEPEDWRRYDSGATFDELDDERKDAILQMRGEVTFDEIFSRAASISLEDFL